MNTAIQTYKPFIIGLSVVISATLVLSLLRTRNMEFHQIMNSFMGFFFIVFALPKFFNLTGFVETFRQYDLISQHFPLYAKAFPVIELGLGIVLLSGVLTGSSLGLRLLNVVIALVAGVTLLGVVRSLRQKKRLDCACMGAAFKFPLSKVAVAENGAMLIMAIAMIASSHGSHMMMALAQLRMVG